MYLDKLIDDVSHDLRPRNLTSIRNDDRMTQQHSNQLIELTTDTFESIVLNPNQVNNHVRDSLENHLIVFSMS